MKLILIAALNSIRVIGNRGVIPWKIPEDLQRFKAITVPHTVLMGRKTFESIGKPLPDRKNVVLSRGGSVAGAVLHYSSLQKALDDLSGEEKVFVIGGGELYRQTINAADELLLTIVENEMEGDTLFPPFEHLIGREFILRSRQQFPGYRFEEYVR